MGDALGLARHAGENVVIGAESHRGCNVLTIRSCWKSEIIGRTSIASALPLNPREAGSRFDLALSLLHSR